MTVSFDTEVIRGVCYITFGRSQWAHGTFTESGLSAQSYRFSKVSD